MSNIYFNLYHNLCESRKQMKESYCYKSGLHKHHIAPKHSGGNDNESNFTYLTVREHIIAHFLLWKIYKNPNDLRSMKMLGGNLSVEQRIIIGKWCKENNIGFHGASKEQKKIWSKKGVESQKHSGDNNSFYWWSTEEGRKKRASMGGKASIQSGNNKKFLYWMSNEGRKKRAHMGGKALIGMICVTNGTHRTRIKPEKLEEYINLGYRRGFTLSS